MTPIEGLDPSFQAIGTLIFVVIIAAYSAFSYITGRKPTAKTETKEFAVTGQLADMGPVKELIEQTGLVAQQLIRQNIALEANAKAQEATAKALGRFAELYEHRVEDEQREREIADEVDRRLRQRNTPK